MRISESIWRSDVKSNMTLSWVTALLLAMPVALSACGGKEERMAFHMEKAKAYYEQGNFDKARVELKNVLQIDPKSAEAFYLSGLIEEKQQNWRNAFGNYRKTVELNPDHLAAKAKLGHLYLLSGAADEAEQMASDILTKKPADPGGRSLKAVLMARKGEIAGAIQEASEAVTADPAQTDAVNLLAKLYSRQGDHAKAQEVLQKAIEVNPTNISLRLELASIFMKRNELEKAEQQFKDVVAVEPNKLEHRIALATFYSRTNQLDKAEKTLREAILEDPDDERRYLLLTEFLVERKGAAEQAEKELLSAIQAKPKAYKLRFGLAKLYQAMNRPEKALHAYQDIIKLSKSGPEGLNARTQLARMYITAGTIAEADKLVAEVLKENPKDNEALVLRGQLSLAKGDAQSAIADIRRVLKDYPESAEIVALLARAHLANNEPQLAKDALNNAVVKYPDNPNVRLAKADFLASTKEYEPALKEVDAVFTIDPKNVRAFQLKADIQTAKKDWKAAEETLAKLKMALPGDPLGYYRLGLIYHAQQKYDQAIAEFEMALKKAPRAIEPLTAMANSLVAQGKVTKAIARINEVQEAAPADFRPHLLLGTVYLNQKKYAEAESAFHSAIQVNPKASASYLALSNLYLGRGDAKAAIQSLQQGLSSNPGDAMLSASLAERYHQSGDYEKAIAEYENILKKNPASDWAANNLAFLLTEVKGDKAALERARELAKRFENASNPAFIDTLGWIYVKLDRPEVALPLLQKAVEKAPRAPLFQYHLGIAFYKKGDLSSAKTHLQKALDAKISFAGIEEAREVLAKL